MSAVPRVALALGLALSAFAPPAEAACVATAGTGVCTIERCGPLSVVTVTVAGPGSGTATCGGASASCTSFRGEPCTAFDDTGGVGGVLGCSSTGSAVAICSIVIAST